MVYIIDSRRMDLKHFQKVSVLKNCYPIGYRTDNDDNESDQTEFTLEFTCDPYQNIGVEEAWKSFMRSHCNDLTGMVDTNAEVSTPKTLLTNNLTEATEIVPDIPDDPISGYVDKLVDGVNERNVKEEI